MTNTGIETQLWVYWLINAVEHAAEATNAASGHMHEVDGEVVRVVGSMTGTLLDDELRAALIAVSGAAHTIDAVYGAVSRFVVIDPTTLAAWRANRTPRATQILETMKRGYALGSATSRWASDLAWLFSLRDASVHFQARYRAVVEHHSGINTAQENVDFSALNAARAVAIASEVVQVAVGEPKPGMPDLKLWASDRYRLLDAIEQKAGTKLFNR